MIDRTYIERHQEAQLAAGVVATELLEAHDTLSCQVCQQLREVAAMTNARTAELVEAVGAVAELDRVAALEADGFHATAHVARPDANDAPAGAGDDVEAYRG